MHPPPLPCRPPFWAKGPHTQTLLGHLLPSSAPEPSGECLDIPMGDGDVLRSRVAQGVSGVVVYLFHGLGGSTASDYMRRSAALFAGQGHTVVAVNHRGAGEGQGLAKRPYHMGCTSDLAAVIQAGRALMPDLCHVAVGFSLSASALLLLLGRDHGLAQPDGAIAVNPAFDLEKASLRLAQGFNRIYDFRFVRLLVQHLEARKARGWVNPAPVLPTLATLRAFDACYTARAVGFKDRDDYYAQCSCGPWVRRIAVPTVVISAEDDPFVPPRDLDRECLPPAVHLHVEPTGGHMGYLGQGVAGRRWLDHALDHYLGALLQNLEVQPRSAGVPRMSR